jgi:histidinol phosphatase-like PHP family hydrolase
MIKGITFPNAREITNRYLSWDLHAHTNFVDGKNSVKEMIDAAEKKSFEVFAITEHVRSEWQFWWPRYVEEIKRHRINRNLTVLIGFEANAIGPAGNVDVVDEMWDDVEIAIGAVHGYYHDDSWEKLDPEKLSSDDALDYEIEKALGLCDNPRIDVIAHPFWLYREHFGDPPDQALRLAFDKAKKTHTAVEISPQSLQGSSTFRKVLMDINPVVSFGSNAHSVAEIASVLPLFKEVDV